MSAGRIKKGLDDMQKNIVKGYLKDLKIEDKDIYEIYNN
jgi:hypothetical protein